MKAPILNLFAILLLLSSHPLIFGKAIVMAHSGVIRVPEDFSTIQAAINDANAGDMIFVRAGTYQEDLVVNKSVSLVGEDRISTIIHGDTASHVILITAFDVNIANFTVKKSSATSYTIGIFVSSTRRVTIHDNIIANNDEGIVFYLSSSNMVRNNVIVSNSNGVSLYFSNNNAFFDNFITQNSEGIMLYDSNNNNVSGNLISNNSLGVVISRYSANNRFYHNNFHDRISVVTGAINSWSYGNQGNFWVSYTGRDANHDGIGDESYQIDANNKDDYPLMGDYSELTIIFREKSYPVTFISNSTISDLRFRVGAETGNRIMQFILFGENGSIIFCRIAISIALMDAPFILLDGEEESIPHFWKSIDKTEVYLYFTSEYSNQTITLISSYVRGEHQKLQMDFDNLNVSYNQLMNSFSALLSNYSQLQQSHLMLNLSYYDHLTEFNITAHNLRNLIYVFAAFTAVFLLTTIYLSKNSYVGNKLRIEKNEDEK